MSAVGAGKHPEPETAVTSELETVLSALRKRGTKSPKVFHLYQRHGLTELNIIIDPLLDGLPEVIPFGKLYGSFPGTLKPNCVKAESLKPKVHLVKHGSLYQPSPIHKKRAAEMPEAHFYTLEKERGIHCPARVFLVGE
ncbi:MAG: hypothetical protein COB37_05990 [Kordiimonadales bacterium]|nr:MAG: hypothetical protein COB37_05990 [Kordiimonadales bacterium]